MIDASFRRYTPLLLIALAIPFSTSAAPDKTLEEVLQMARSNIAPERKLNQVDSLRYTGKMTRSDSGEVGSFELLLAKPKAQRLTIEFAGTKEVTTSDGVEGFVLVESIEADNRWHNILNHEQVERVALNSFENLNFFKGTRRMLGRASLQGVEDYRGDEAYRVKFRYPGDYYFIRFFDVETGDLLGTIDDRGTETVEKGDFEVAGYRFPREIETYKDGELVQEIEFTDIDVNPEVPAATFEIPMRIR